MPFLLANPITTETTHDLAPLTKVWSGKQGGDGAAVRGRGGHSYVFSTTSLALHGAEASLLVLFALNVALCLNIQLTAMAVLDFPRDSVCPFSLLLGYKATVQLGRVGFFIEAGGDPIHFLVQGIGPTNPSHSTCHQGWHCEVALQSHQSKAPIHGLP
eukprot:CAMPEP_0115177130 /NCGR_PEP_ID=MMETSP0270-20121206/5223_1 /TAXON_ID=71861 /ORGANISM="Scrippsiella trochoidea, Strain CCMP3099" /LENGTH=157 /DNA_ID=CAMNT_0002590045 /DNA_START=501 /DNA_END=970 /DNA_ORIENTATION=-